MKKMNKLFYQNCRSLSPVWKKKGRNIYLFIYNNYIHISVAKLVRFFKSISTVISDICSVFLFLFVFTVAYHLIFIYLFIFYLFILLIHFFLKLQNGCIYSQLTRFESKMTEKHNRLFPLPLWRTSCLLKRLKDYVRHAVWVSSARNRMISYQGHMFLIYQRNLISSKTDHTFPPPSRLPSQALTGINLTLKWTAQKDYFDGLSILTNIFQCKWIDGT